MTGDMLDDINAAIAKAKAKRVSELVLQVGAFFGVLWLLDRRRR